MTAAADAYWIAARVDESTGWQVSAVRMAFGNVRLCVGPPGETYYDRGWCYRAPARQDAIDAVESWNGEGDPPGRWYKDLQTQETRPGYLWTDVRQGAA